MNSIKKLTVLFLVVASLALAATRVQETLYNADGTKAAGRIHLEWSPVVSPSTRMIAGGVKDVTLANGLFTATLEPTLYKVTYLLNGVDATTEYWQVPDSTTTVTVQSVRTLSPEFAMATTDGLPEGTQHLWYTDTRVKNLLSGLYQPLISGAPSSWPTLWPWTSLSGTPSTFTPAIHASNHAAGGSDPLTPAAIGADVAGAAAIAQAASVPLASKGQPGGVLGINADGSVSVGNTVSAPNLIPQPTTVSMTYGFQSQSTVTILGTATAMSLPNISIQCLDLNNAALSCTPTYSVNATNSSYNDISVAFGSSQSGQVIVTGVQSYTYYVDGANGLDSNVGTSTTTAFKTLRAAQAAWTTAGQTIGVAGYGTLLPYRETLTTTAAYQGVFGYGSRLPLIDASDPILTSAWTKTVGYTNIYQATEPFEPSSPNTTVRVLENVEFMPIAASLAALDSAPGSMYVANNSSSPTTIYVNATSGNPIANGLTYYYTRRQFAINASGYANPTVAGVWTRRNLHDSGSMYLQGDNAWVANSMATDGSRHNILVGQNFLVTDTTAQHEYYPGGASTLFVASCQSCTGTPGMFIRDKAVETPGWIGATGSVGYYGHAASGSAYTNVIWDYCSSVGNPTSYGFAATTYNVLNSTGDGTLNAYGTTSTTVTGTKIITASKDALYSNQAGSTITVSYSTLSTSATTGSGGMGVEIEAPLTLAVSYSTISAPNTWYGFYFGGGTPTSVNLQHNTLTSGLLYYDLPVIPTTFLSDYNTFVAAGSGTRMQYGATQYTLAAYKTASGQDAHSTP